MMFAKIVDIDCGLDNGEKLKSKGYKVGDVFEVKHISMSASRTTVTMSNDEKYNSVHFNFFDDVDCTKERDIYNEPLYNPFLRN
jgi:hypothetical protein